jgi:hypothetical protein
MGFALWIKDDCAWAAGTHEYRPMGTAVIARSAVFTPRDFSPRLPRPRAHAGGFVGHFASLGEINFWLRKRRGLVRPRGRGGLPYL